MENLLKSFWISRILIILMVLHFGLLIFTNILFICCCSVAQLCPTLCDPMDCSTLGLPVHHQFPEFTQADVH